ncbi:hypothetical protein [Rathayibacter tanaceti]|uniref:ZIP Zinc transporter n=2 Tax=Rathayibacter tanaceti TaxID=1671680 RepID=A0A166HBM0_9MICO|nr:hypothetical protein [Rathayibacter tanaceti]KZX20312.1 hypothetical protein ACH61_02576 [Rathayibacter tanaceti]QHC56385.1 hypothetical protein GSU10_12575 [Rathayibacter tanaceti]TCO34913.1 hypothetical protein EV639_11067 [Rathayibacter tanaceti]
MPPWTLALVSGAAGGATLLIGAALAWLVRVPAKLTAALVGFLVFASAPGAVVAFVTTVAAGAILAMISNTMIPEAFDRDDVMTGMYAVLGFVTAFALHAVA